MPEETRGLLMKLIQGTLEAISAPNGLKSEQAIARAAKRLTDEFGNFTLEDWKLCLYEMEAGRSLNHYNNTNLEWLIKCFAAYDERKLAELRAYHAEQAQKWQDDAAQVYRGALEAVASKVPPTRTLTDLLKGESRITWEEREAMHRRDLARREAQTKAKMRALVRAQYRAGKKNDTNQN